MSMDAQFQGLLWTFGLDFLVFLACFIYFGKSVKQGFRWGVNTPLLDASPPSKSKSVVDAPLPAFVSRIFLPIRVPSSQELLYARFLQFGALLFGALSVFGLCVLLPVYATGDSNPSSEHPTWLSRATAGNEPAGSSSLWSSFAMVWVFVALAVVALWYYSKNLKSSRDSITKEDFNQRHQDLVTASCTLHLIQVEPRSALDSSTLHSFCARKWGDSVQHVALPYDLRSFSKSFHALREATDQLTRLRALDEQHLLELAGGEPPAVWQGCCQKATLHAAIDKMQRRVDELVAAVRESLRSPLLTAGHAFVVCKDAQGVPSEREAKELGARAWNTHARPAWRFSALASRPMPDDIVWDNLPLTRNQQRMRTVLGNFLLFWLMVAVISPVVLLSRLDQILHSHDDKEVDKEDTNVALVLLTSYLPPLVVFLVNSIVLPYLIEITAAFECHWFESSRMRSVYTKNVVFLFLNIFFLPTCTLNSISAALHYAYSTQWGDWSEIMGTIFLSSSGYFYLQYFIHATFLSAASQMLCLPQRLGRWWKRRHVVTEAEREALNKLEPFDFAYFFSVRATIFGIGLVYSVVTPLLLPLTALYFLVHFVVDSFLFQQREFFCAPKGDFNRLGQSVIQTCVVYLALFLFCMGGFFIVQNTAAFISAGSFLILVLVVATLVIAGRRLATFAERGVHDVLLGLSAADWSKLPLIGAVFDSAAPDSPPAAAEPALPVAPPVDATPFQHPLEADMRAWRARELGEGVEEEKEAVEAAGAPVGGAAGPRPKQVVEVRPLQPVEVDLEEKL